VSVFILAVGVGACATLAPHPTPYQPSGFSGGYEDQRVGQTQFVVSVSGNAYTSETTLLGYFHRRATELCQSIGYGGYSYQLSTQASQTETTPKTYTVDKTYDGNTEHTTIQEHPATSIQKYSVSGSIVCNTSTPAAAANAPAPGITLQEAQSAFLRLQRGLTREQVAQILGSPSYTETTTAGQDTGRAWLALKWNYVWNGGTGDQKGLSLLFADQGGWRLHYWAWY
jgi:hypothetical protein